MPKSRLRRAFNPGGLDVTLLPRVARNLNQIARAKFQTHPKSASALEASELYRRWWYYSVELLPGIETKGIYPAGLPFLPRMLLRNCNLQGMDCLDLGSMEGLLPTLMCRQGARSVLATDANFHCYEKLTAVKEYYDVDFRFRQIGLMYELSKKLMPASPRGFDFINLSGVLYHVFSPMHVLAGVRPLLRRNGLMIVSTNVVDRSGSSMEFNDAGRLQTEANTFWYISIPFFDYMLRYFRLLPIDCMYLPNTSSDPVRYSSGTNTGYLSVVCKAVDEMQERSIDKWAIGSMRNSWEYIELCSAQMPEAAITSRIEYRTGIDSRYIHGDGSSIDLHEAARGKEPMLIAGSPHDSHTLRLLDQD